MIFLDSTVIISSFTISPDKHRCNSYIQSNHFVTDSLVVAESTHNIEKLAGKNTSIIFLKWILQAENIKILDLNGTLLLSLLYNIPKIHVPPYDCIHYSAAETFECEAICTYDKDFDKLPIKRVEP